jgi:hypothetical protein
VLTAKKKRIKVDEHTMPLSEGRKVDEAESALLLLISKQMFSVMLFFKS